MIRSLAERIAAAPRARAALAGAAAIAAALLAFAPGELGPTSARAAVVVAALAGAALLVGRRRTAAPGSAALHVVARAPLGPGAGLAVVDAAGRRLLVGFGREGVRLVAELGASGEERP